MIVVTVCNIAEPGLMRLHKSVKAHGMRLEVLGMHRLYFGVADKFVYLLEYLKNGCDDEFVMFLDAFDTVVVAHEDEIVQKYCEFEAQIVSSAEIPCWPDAHRKVEFVYTIGERYPFNNSGAYIARVSSLIELLQGYDLKLGSGKDDQRLMADTYLSAANCEQSIIKLDARANIFQSMFGVDDEEVKFNKDEGRVVNTVTGTRPCVIHGNGKSSMQSGIDYLQSLPEWQA